MDIEILLRIKKKMNIDLNFDLNWNRNIKLSDFDNIEIHDDNLLNYKTKILDFEDYGLTGKIATEVGLLKGLNTLYFDENELTGKIPREIGQLINLNNLYLNENILSGKIPIEICKLITHFSLKNRTAKQV
jgi:hypothetical protein